MGKETRNGAEFLYPLRHLSGLFIPRLGGRDGGGDGERTCLRQPWRGVRPVLLRLRHGGCADGRGLRRPAFGPAGPLSRLCGGRHRGGVGDGQAAGAGAPPPLVGLLGQEVQSGRLCLPAIFGALGSVGHGQRPMGQRPAAAPLRPPAGVAAACGRLGHDDDRCPRPAGHGAGRQPVRRQPPEAGTVQP